MREENEMLDLIEIRKEVESDIAIDLVDDDYCIDIIHKGNLLKGYGLWLAKEIVHKDSNTGWTKFCEKAGISRKMAYDSIEFYTAKSCAIAPKSLPDKEGTFRALKGATVEAKVDLYSEVKELTGKDEPTAKDITVVTKTRDRVNASDEKHNEYIAMVFQQSPAVQDEYVKTLGKRGVSKAIAMMADGSSDEDIITELQEKKVPKQKMLTDNEKSKLSDIAKRKVKAFEQEFEQLKEENKKLRAAVKMNEIADELMKFVKNVYHSYRFIVESKKSNERLFQTRLLPHVESALETLEMATNIESDLDDLKKAYRVMAKKHHPDKGGNQDAFVEIKKAYDTLKKYIK